MATSDSPRLCWNNNPLTLTTTKADSCKSCTSADVEEELTTPDPNNGPFPEELTPRDIDRFFEQEQVQNVPNADASSVLIDIGGLKRSITGLVKLLQEEGKELQAALLQDMDLLQKESQKFFKAKRRATATGYKARKKDDH